jgi:hypothetical protein
MPIDTAPSIMYKAALSVALSAVLHGSRKGEKYKIIYRRERRLSEIRPKNNSLWRGV